MTICFYSAYLYASATHSPYVKQVDNPIKALSKSDIEGLKNGSGMPFGGMAKAAELNGYPGPRHVLDLKDELKLTKEQITNTEAVYKKMHKAALALGTELIAIERSMDTKLKEKKLDSKTMKSLTQRSAQIYGDLRFTHLQAHLEMVTILTKEQIAAYNQLRGYNSQDPCKNIPKGHPVDMWKQHHNCT